MIRRSIQKYSLVIISSMLYNFNKIRNIHKNEDIYIIASGPSLDFIDSSFFNNKITIGLNQVYKKIKTKYLLRKESEFLEEVIKETPGTIHFISNGSSGGENLINKDKCIELTQMNSSINICCFDHNANKHQLPDELPENGLVVSYSSITSAIHLAAYMGAKNIILVGHDCGVLDNKANYQGYHTKETLSVVWQNELDYKKWLSKDIEKDTIKLKGILKKIYNVNIYSLNPFINFGLEGHIYKKV
jgi:hypothetical protein